MKRKIEFKKRQKNPWISFRFWDKLFMYCVKTVQSYTSFSQRHQGWINIKKTKIDQHGNVAWPEQKNEFYEKKKTKKNAYLIYFISLNPLNIFWILFSQTVKILAKLNSTNASCSKTKDYANDATTWISRELFQAQELIKETLPVCRQTIRSCFRYHWFPPREKLFST